MTRTVVGVFDRYDSVESAERALHAAGFGDSQIHITEQPNGRDNASGTQDEGMLSGVRNFFSDIFGDNDSDRDAAQYAQAMRMGWTVVKVDADEDRVSAAALALEQAGAVDIDAKAEEWRADGWNEGLATPGAVHNERTAAEGTVEYPPSGSAGLTGLASTPDTTGRVATTGTEQVIPVVRESIEVGKRQVSTGGVRVYSRVVETPVNESVELRSEHAEVHRRPVDRPVTSADVDALGDRTIEVLETAERAVVSKTARVVEEVSIGKSVQSHTEQVRDTLRSTEVEVEHLQGDDTALAGDDLYRQHFQSRYGDTASYEDYAPAYQYGATLRDDPRYAGRDWESFEADARTDWEGRHPGSGWERFKEAVRHAWQGAKR
ncbi:MULTISPECIES: YsnF/AvaK domain-containing protein [Aquincola]|uniref:YsnF/AvaK domain-containing protein n=1 Tax=Aquincola TaxID=391952 RepID=UPI000614C6E6|nr:MULTISPECIES: YsnF/AvaK domain-containing protein [Aquincola]MCR5868318.1 YsnF/AvaK domain-containing protein [Aquincola sp. J276]